MMNRRQVILSVMVGILGLANIWYWWPARPAQKTEPAAESLSRQFRLEDFQIKTLPPAPDTPMERDLFFPKYVPPPRSRPKPPPPPSGPPPKTPEELAREAAQAELSQFKCMGVLFRDGKGQAYLVNGDQIFLAVQGQKVGDRFIVDKITPEGVLLRDPATDISGQVPVSGK